jgi:hypothetical protein
MFFNVQGAEIPVVPYAECPGGGAYGMDEEYELLVRFFGGKDCLDLKLDEFQVVVSPRYEAAYRDVEAVNGDIWRMSLTSLSLGKVEWAERESGKLEVSEAGRAGGKIGRWWNRLRGW